MTLRWISRGATATVVVVGLLLLPGARSAGPVPSANAAVRCDAVAAPSGDDRADGSRARPVRSVGRLLARLRPGQTGCLRNGRWHEDGKVEADDVTLRSAPGQRATIQGRLWIARSATDVKITDLGLDGRSRTRLPSPTINGSRSTFSRVDVTNHRTGICFLLGGSRWGDPTGTTIEDSRIHDCGRRPSTNREHGIYIGGADRTTIAYNAIYANADRGIQLYPDARRTLIVGNVIYGNGEGIIFSGAGRLTSRENTVTANVIADSRLRADVESFYPAGTPLGVGNIVQGNCLYGGRSGTIDRSGGGFAVRDNIVADPQLQAPSRGDFRMPSDGPCAAILRRAGAAAGPPNEPPTP